MERLIDVVKILKKQDKNLNVGVIDSGVTYELLEIFNIQMSNYKCFFDDKNPVCDLLGHGSFVVQIIKNIFPNANFYIFNAYKNFSTSQNAVCAGIEWMLENNIQLVNLSSSSSDLIVSKKILTVLERMVTSNLVMVASAIPKPSFPSIITCPNILTVSDLDMFQNNTISDEVHDTIDIIIKRPFKNLFDINKKKYITVPIGTSFSAATMTGFLLFLKSMLIMQDETSTII